MILFERNYLTEILEIVRNSTPRIMHRFSLERWTKSGSARLCELLRMPGVNLGADRVSLAKVESS